MIIILALILLFACLHIVDIPYTHPQKLHKKPAHTHTTLLIIRSVKPVAHQQASGVDVRGLAVHGKIIGIVGG